MDQFIVILFSLLTTHAQADLKSIDKSGIDKLVNNAAEILLTCPGVRGTKNVSAKISVTEFLNKTDEHLDRNVFISSLQKALKVKLPQNESGEFQLKMEIKSIKKEVDGEYTGNYILKIKVMKKTDEACSVDATYKKTGRQ